MGTAWPGLEVACFMVAPVAVGAVVAVAAVCGGVSIFEGVCGSVCEGVCGSVYGGVCRGVCGSVCGGVCGGMWRCV